MNHGSVSFVSAGGAGSQDDLCIVCGAVATQDCSEKSHATSSLLPASKRSLSDKIGEILAEDDVHVDLFAEALLCGKCYDLVTQVDTLESMVQNAKSELRELHSNKAQNASTYTSMAAVYEPGVLDYHRNKVAKSEDLSSSNDNRAFTAEQLGGNLRVISGNFIAVNGLGQFSNVSDNTHQFVINDQGIQIPVASVGTGTRSGDQPCFQLPRQASVFRPSSISSPGPSSANSQIKSSSPHGSASEYSVVPKVENSDSDLSNFSAQQKVTIVRHVPGSDAEYPSPSKTAKKEAHVDPKRGVVRGASRGGRSSQPAEGRSARKVHKSKPLVVSQAAAAGDSTSRLSADSPSLRAGDRVVIEQPLRSPARVIVVNSLAAAASFANNAQHNWDGLAQMEMEDSSSSWNTRPVEDGNCFVCGLGLSMLSPGFQSSTVMMDASRVMLDERLGDIIGVGSPEQLQMSKTLTCVRCVSLIMRVDFLEVELPKTKAHVRYLFSKNPLRLAEQLTGNSGSKPSPSSRRPQIPSSYPSGLISALTKPLQTSSANALSNSGISSRYADHSPPESPGSRNERGPDAEDDVDDEEDGERKRKRPLPAMRPIEDSKPNVNGIGRSVSGGDDDDADEMPKKVMRHDVRGNGASSPAPSKTSSVAESDQDAHYSMSGDEAERLTRRLMSGDLNAFGPHGEFAGLESAIAERLKANDEAVKLGNALDASGASNILNSLSSLSSLVGADPSAMGLGMRGFAGRNPLLARPGGGTSGGVGGGVGVGVGGCGNLVTDGLCAAAAAAAAEQNPVLLGLSNPSALNASFRHQSLRPPGKPSEDYAQLSAGLTGSDSHAKCWLCHMDCRTYKKVEEHFKKEHPGETPFVCDKCGGEFRDLSSYRNHVYYENRKEKLAKGQLKPKSGSGSLPMMVPNSSTSPGPSSKLGRPPFSLGGSLDTSTPSSTSSGILRCEPCKLPFTSETALKDHFAKEHNSNAEDFQMSMEQYALYSQALFNAHKEYMLSQQKEAAAQLQRQMQQFGVAAAAAVNASGKSSSSSSSSGTAASNGSFVCDECTAPFRSKEALSIHKFQDHGAKDSLQKL
ncbi:unnamed protein product [Notodromas monacha]|uniref:C2H2-type domain-containing protein n=1 Tax=Notodromas monacha TaxID=399045 RepID=A0A7R9GBT4_9CRUS|nr:unnamed protein product [Notodromas monacha]CAG0916863.1 unnamed protein product [Notodromas monacha]